LLSSQILDQKFARKLDELHREVMALIDVASCYHHEQGGLQCTYPPETLHFYQNQMRQLSNRLYQMATLLMLHRAARDGDMRVEDVARESAKIELESVLLESDNPAWNDMEEVFCRLNRRSFDLLWQMQHLLGLTVHQGENEPHQQLRKIEAAFIKSPLYRQGEQA